MLIHSIKIAETSALPAEATARPLELHGSPGELLAAEHVPADRVAALLITRGTGLPTAADQNLRRSAIVELETLIEYAGRLGARRISLAPAVVRADASGRITYTDALNQTADACLALERELARAGVRLALRASVDGFLTSPPELGELVAAMNSPMIGVDVDSAERSDALPLEDWIDALASAVCAIGIRGSADAALIKTAAACGADAVVRHGGAME